MGFCSLQDAGPEKEEDNLRVMYNGEFVPVADLLEDKTYDLMRKGEEEPIFRCVTKRLIQDNLPEIRAFYRELSPRDFSVEDYVWRVKPNGA